MAFYRQIALPEGVDPELAQAEYRNGMLSIRFPKQQRQNVRQIPVNTQASEQGSKEQSKERAA